MLIKSSLWKSRLNKKVNNTLSLAKKTYDKAFDRHVCIGITGLSRSGKTTLITSLINQLCHYDTAKLAGFPPIQADRLLGVKLHPLDDLPMFPYTAGYQKITAAQPEWPDSTSEISGCLIELRLKKSHKSLVGKDNYSLFIELRDYPGEWLLDLPLRDMSFVRWCGLCSAQYLHSPRLELLGSLLDEFKQLDPFAPVDKEKLQALNEQYKQFLSRCKNDEKSLSLIQPGRFLIPGKLPDADIVNFIPLLACIGREESELEQASEHSYYKVCKRRYQRYIKELVEPFYSDFFSGIDRQLVLVDVISALHSGPAYLDDMRQALTNITQSFSYGNQSRLRQLFSPKVDRLIFAATKIDLVLSKEHEAVRQLLSAVVRSAYKHARSDGISPICEAVAAVRASNESSHIDNALEILTPEGKRLGYVPPVMPSKLPDDKDWQALQGWVLPELSPPRGLSSKNNTALPHIRLDTLLNELIGDKCP